MLKYAHFLLEKLSIVVCTLFVIVVSIISPASALTQVSECGIYSTANDILNLTRNIENTTTASYCILMNGANQTFEGNGFYIINRTYTGDILWINKENQTVNNLTVGASSSNYGFNIRESRAIIKNSNISGGSIGVIMASSKRDITIKDSYFSNQITYDIYTNGPLTNLTYQRNIHTNWSGQGYLGAFALRLLYNSTASNNIFKDTNRSTDAVAVRIYDGDNLLFYNNSFLNNSRESYGIYLGNVNNSQIFNNTFQDNSVASASTISLYLSPTSRNNQIYNNLFNSTTNYFYANDLGQNNVFHDNRYICNKNTDSNHGLKLDTINATVYNEYIRGCTFGLLFHNGTTQSRAWNITSFNSSVGVYFLADSSYNTLTNSTITLSVTYGIAFYDDKTSYLNVFPPRFNNVSNVIIQNQTGSSNAIYYRNQSHDNLVRDSIIRYTSSGNDISAEQESPNNTLLNVTYNLSRESISAGSNIIRKWYFQANVTNSSASAISGVNVTVYNRTNDYQFNLTTSSAGLTTLQEIIDYINNGGTRTYYSNYTFFASKSAYTAANQSQNITSSQNTLMSFILLNTDITPPQITIVYPSNTTYSINVSNINYTISETNPDKCWYSIDNGVTNSTPHVMAGTNFTNVISDEGSNTWTVYCNDSFGNENSTSVTFFKDTVYPLISITSPSNNTNTTNTQIEINYSTSDTNIQACWWTNNSGLSNHSITCGTNITGVTWDEGLNIITIYANDTANNINSSSVTFRLDSLPPSVSIIFPQNNTNTTNTQLGINYTASDSGVGLSSCWYTRNNGATNTTLDNCVNVTGVTWGEGTNNVTIYVNDSLNNVNSTSVRFYVDSINPTINFTYPTETQTILSRRNILLNVTSTDANLKNITIYLYNSTLSLINSTNSTTSPLFYNFSLSTDGIYYFNATAYDNFGNKNSTETRNVTIDSTPPLISVIFPMNNTNTTNTQLEINYTVSDLHLSSCWWTNNSGTSNHSINCGTNITSIVWNEGFNIIQIYVNDTINNQNSSSLTFFVDSTPPTVNLISPPNSTNTNNATVTFSCNITDAQISNLTLYIWNSTQDLNYTNTTVLSGVSNSTNWTRTLSSGRYYWNCLGKDLLGNSAWSLQNNTILIDTLAPVIHLISPEDNHEENISTTATFVYNVTDTNNANCSLIIDGLVRDTNSSVNISGANNTFTYSSSTGMHNWSINCTDIAGNTANSSSRTLNISYVTLTEETDIDQEQSSSGGGNFVSDIGELKDTPVDKTIYRNGVINFKLENNKHRMKLTKLTQNSATVTIYSEPVTETLMVGEEKMIDLNGDDIYDLYLKLNSIKNALVASFTIKAIHESTLTPQENKENQTSGEQNRQRDTTTNPPQINVKKDLPFGMMFIVAIVALVLVFAIIFIIFKISKKKRILRTRNNFRFIAKQYKSS
jgi:hypothetical protein